MPHQACAFVISCEHAANAVPPGLAALFQGADAVLASHRGWDPGALDAARLWAARWNAPLFATKATRLVCDANRNERNPSVWSAYTRHLPRKEKEDLLARWHRPHRQAVTDEISRLIATDRTVLHLAVHSFTPELDGTVRMLDLGLLYDPARPGERALAAAWQQTLELPQDGPLSFLRVRRNAPYRGIADGLPTVLRRLFPADRYLGFEVEFNQALLNSGPFPALAVVQALETALKRF